MGYYYTTEPENVLPTKFWASPKTHTPDPRMKERGFRYYQPEVGRWLGRDPIGEKAFFRLFVKGKAIEMQLELSRRGNNPVYLFVDNDPVERHDAFGLSVTAATPFDPCQTSGIDEGNQGGVVCYKGTAYPCVWAKNWPGGKITTPAVLICAQLHEQTHADNNSKYAIPCNPESCGVTRSYDKKDKHADDECTAWKATADCVEKIVIEGEPAEDYLWIVKAIGKWKQSCMNAGKWPK